MGGLAAIGGSGLPGPASLRIGAGRWPAVGRDYGLRKYQVANEGCVG